MTHDEEQLQIKQWLTNNDIVELFHETTFAQMSLRQLQPGELLVENGDQVQHLYIQVEGKLKISTALPNGRTLLLRFCQPISLIGDIELINGEQAKVFVEAINTSTVIAIPYRALQEYELKHAQFLRYLLDHVSHKLNSISLSASVNVLTSVENRFASYLISIAQNTEHLKFKRGELETTKLTEIAELLGTSYRHLNRVIKKFVDQKLIQKNYNGIVIIDMEGLQKLSNGSLYQ
ncbi:MAG: cyclic nucleotide-binding domain-containing protein [Candidatus Pristimantibacillus lignocellulolyticus]|uniref:Cyclic nucleotide-binding domain-containing protein n=1 Tax=Candidatus Pristimantibacillus lignocellulolyticus TaxID=2994561 RepID=A0A9J6ZJY3_9BACL|nr:MAG: cyclic nucleotide-binding domain-containing protein [Candidatus Pristimantibacillus lignocellulolyticus]